MPVQLTLDGKVPVKVWSKDIDPNSMNQVMDNQSDLVEIVAELKQVLCVKG